MRTQEQAVDQELRAELEKLFNKLQQKGLVTASMAENKNTIIDSLAKTFTENKMDAKSLKEPVTQMRAMAAMISKGLGMEKLEKSFTESLKNNPKGKLNELDKLSLALFFMLRLNKDQPAKKLEPKSLYEHFLASFKELVLLKHGDNKDFDKDRFEKVLSDAAKLKNTPAKESLQELFEAQIHGGIKEPGGIQHQALMAGFAMVLQPGRQFVTNGNDCSLLAELCTYKSDKMNYGGVETLMKDEDLEKGVIDTIGETLGLDLKNAGPAANENPAPAKAEKTESAPAPRALPNPFKTTLDRKK